MPFTGTLQSWQDDRGFGFIEPAQGGQAVFVHIKSFTSRGGSRPQVGQRVTFEVELNAQGKKRAKNVAVVSAAAATSAAPRQRRVADSPAQWGTASLFALPAFLLVYVAVAVFWRVPGWVAALYAGVGKHAAHAESGGRVAGRTGYAAGAAPQVEQGHISCGVLGHCGGQCGGLCGTPFAVGCGLASLNTGMVLLCTALSHDSAQNPQHERSKTDSRPHG